MTPRGAPARSAARLDRCRRVARLLPRQYRLAGHDADEEPARPKAKAKKKVAVADDPPPAGAPGDSLTGSNPDGKLDELARAAEADPIAFRLAHLPAGRTGERMKGVLEDVRSRSGWDEALPAGRARGVAFNIGTGTHVAMVTEISAAGGQIRVERVTVSVDAGLVVNPANAALQAKGSVVMGISSTLIEKLTLENGAIREANFDSYPILKLEQTPRQIDVHFMPSKDDPNGMGEPVIGPVGAAIANALFALTGKRARSLPLTV